MTRWKRQHIQVGNEVPHRVLNYPIAIPPRNTQNVWKVLSVFKHVQQIQHRIFAFAMYDDVGNTIFQKGLVEDTGMHITKYSFYIRIFSLYHLADTIGQGPCRGETGNPD